jgi:hypothetical protein
MSLLNTRIVVLIERMHAYRSLLTVALLAFAGSFCFPALGQSTGITPELRRIAQLSTDQAAVVQQYVRENSANLSSDNPDLIRRNRAALLEPLADEQTSPAFRLKYSELLMPLIGPLATNKSEIVVINALVIAGDLATAQSTDVLKAAASADKPAVRYQAAYGLRRTFEALAAMPTLTMRPDQAEDAVKAIAARLGTERDTLVLDGLVHAGLAACNITSLRSPALINLSNAVSGLAKSADAAASPTLAPVLLRAGLGTRDVLSQSLSAQVSADAVKAAAELGGHLIAYCIKAAQTQGIPLAQRGQSEYATRETFAQLATTAENIVLFALTSRGAGSVQAKQLGEKLKAGTASGDVAFVEDALTVVGSTGMLSKAPFSFAPGTFIAN